MELKNFDKILERVPKMSRPMRVILAGSDGENMLRGLFAAQEKGLVQPVLVGDRARTITVLEQFGPGARALHDGGHRRQDTTSPRTAIDIINSGDGDVLMRGNIPTRDFLMPVLEKSNNLRTDRLMSHVSLACSAGVPEAPGAERHDRHHHSPNMSQKKEIIRNTADALKAFGYEQPEAGTPARWWSSVTFHMQDTVEAQRLVYRAEAEVPLRTASCGARSAYDLILSKEAARLKNYDCPWSGGGFDGISRPGPLHCQRACEELAHPRARRDLRRGGWRECAHRPHQPQRGRGGDLPLAGLLRSPGRLAQKAARRGLRPKLKPAGPFPPGGPFFRVRA